MITSDDWTNCQWAKEKTGKAATQTVLISSFWNNIVFSLKVIDGSLVHVLRLVGGQKKLVIGYIYQAMDRAKKAIAQSFEENEDKYKETLKLQMKGGIVSFIILCMQLSTS